MRSVKEIVEGVRLESVCGTVVDAHIWSETHVRGSGSGVMVKGFGVGSSKTTSTMVNKREACIETADGVQIVEAFGADAVTLMPGQEVTLIRAERGSETVTVGVRNHSVRKSMITGKEMFPGVLVLLVASPFVTILALFVLFVYASNVPSPDGTVLLILFGLLFGNLYWVRGLGIRRGFRRRVEEMMQAAEEPASRRVAGTVAA